MPEPYDVAVLGATPAGCAAAYRLVRHKRRVVLVDSPRSGSECPLSDWAPREMFQLSSLPRTLARDCGAVKFQAVHYHDASLAREAHFTSRAPAGHFLRWSDLVAALTAAAGKAGLKTCSMSAHPAIHLGEDLVQLIGSSRVSARMLVIAQDSPQDVLGDLAVPARITPRSPFVAAGLDVPVPAGAWPRKPGASLHVVESRHRGELGLLFLTDKSLHVRVVSSSAASAAPAAEISRLLGGLQKAGVLPAKLPLHRAKGAMWRPPAGEALEMETHVAKRCILAGTAGGFADNITGQTLAPSVRSALIAAEVVHKALDAPDAQGALMRFKNAWRAELADYLRPPSTALHMLLPLLFANDRIVAKFTRALLYGESI